MQVWLWNIFECIADGFFSLTSNTFAYVSCDDVHNVSEFEGQNVVAIKAPRHTRLEVADSQDVSTMYFYYHIISHSTHGSELAPSEKNELVLPY